MTLEETLTMDVLEFIPLVEGNLLMEDERLENLSDALMPFHAKNTAMMVGASGNMGKNYDHMEMARMLYPKEEVWGVASIQTEDMTFEESKESLVNTFNIKQEELKLTKDVQGGGG